ncbi:hypothetical protein CcI49_20180 [Frankia sp. CcI49]|uniref:ferredoxin n=1 Tax=unclassified Frankia TaxID=2632575 RepID=UPI0006CA3925|nr:MULTISPECIES: ferredoxin [unclassified Frankia]KPM54367.1 hypothetical protein ACG83_20775 [Frankia sp. R43]ONH58750.1 hypothetical protein CcI49_20180 [Frankia sp. CcI49]
MTRASVDEARCQGHGRCSLEAPDLFDVSDSGTAFLLVADDLTVAQTVQLDDAIVACPEQAISKSP